ncbi:MAG: cytochrome C [Hyphomicrobiales bacterium]|nr:MAG: cytochrome C [Hyphomicrobiales bacterium]
MLLGAFSGLGFAASDNLDQAQVEQGKELANTYCARCHAVGTDDSSTHPHSPPFRIISKMYPIENLEEAFAEGIYTGHPDMPAFEFSVEKLTALLEYMRSIQQ